MVREHQSNLPVPPMATSATSRKLRSTAKRANTIALDMRNTLSKAGAPGSIAFAVLASPFLIALFMILFGSGPSSPGSDQPHIPHHHAGRLSRRTGWLRSGSTSNSMISSKRALMANLGSIDITASHVVHFDLDRFIKKQRIRHKIDAKPGGKSVTLVAACQNRHQSLLSTYPSWSSIEGIDQIVLVEWGDVPFNWYTIPQFADDMKAKRTTVVLTKGVQHKWSLARAYNLAMKFAIGSYVIKVDCDTFLYPDFLTKNPVPAEGEYYTVTWGAERANNERHLTGVWFAKLSDFERAGGYDERIVTYGYEDIDFYDRMNKLSGLTVKVFDLDSLRHNVGINLAYKQDAQYFVSRRVSIRVNQHMLEGLSKWPDVSLDQGMKYQFFYDTTLKVIVANITRHAPDPLHEQTEAQRDALLTTVLKTGLHDDFELPWDILESLSLDDLLHLAHFCDTDSKPHVLVILLEGKDTLSNMFNLVSATYIAMTRARPTIVVWNLPDDAHVTDASVQTPLLGQLFDLNATNEQLKRIVSSEGILKQVPSLPGSASSTDHVRLMAAHKWCPEPLSQCASKYDTAYKPFWEIAARVPHVYDENDPMPISTSRHTVIRLTDKTLVGSHQLRKLAFQSLVPSHIVRDAQTRAFGGGSRSKVAVVLNEHDDVSLTTEQLKHDYPHVAENAEQGKFLPVTGARHPQLRDLLLERQSKEQFCQSPTECTVQQMGMEIANVLAVAASEQLFPTQSGGTSANDNAAWLQHSDAQRLMATDLWALSNK